MSDQERIEVIRRTVEDCIKYSRSSCTWGHEADIKFMLERYDALAAELNEQARVNGMGGSREAALLAKVARLKAALREAMEWNWIEDASLDGGIPESVVKQCNDALGASELETLPASISVPATTKVDAIGKKSTLCAVCDQIKELHPATHKWTAKETKVDASLPIGYCDGCGRHVWKQETIGLLDETFVNGKTCNGVFVPFTVNRGGVK